MHLLHLMHLIHLHLCWGTGQTCQTVQLQQSKLAASPLWLQRGTVPRPIHMPALPGAVDILEDWRQTTPARNHSSGTSLSDKGEKKEWNMIANLDW